MQKLCELLDAAHVALDVEARDVRSCLHALAERLVANHDIDEAVERNLEAALLDRERLGGTCLGEGVAVPHAYFDGMPRPVLLIARLREPIEYGAPDDKPVDIVFLLAGPLSAQKRHIQLLARIARLFHDRQWPRDLRSARSSQELLEAVRAVEKRHC